MTEQDLQIPMPGGVADAVLFSPDPGKPLAGVLHLPDIGGIREAHRGMARRLSAEGYAVLLVNPFYRTGRPPVFDFPRVAGEPRTVRRLQELAGPLTPDAQNQDTGAYIDFLTSQTAVHAGSVGVVGYCFTGGLALRAAAVRPSQLAAAASFHGGGLYKTDDSGSPHLVLPQITGRLYFGHAVDDKSMDANAIEGLEHALQDWGGRYENEVYEGARHGWTVPDNPVFNPEHADHAFRKLTELFAATLH